MSLKKGEKMQTKIEKVTYEVATAKGKLITEDYDTAWNRFQTYKVLGIPVTLQALNACR